MVDTSSQSQSVLGKTLCIHTVVWILVINREQKLDVGIIYIILPQHLNFNISVISLRSDLLMEETVIPREN
jgi:hypothetical protein